MAKMKSKIITIEVETTLSNRDIKRIVKDNLGEYLDSTIKQVQVAAIDATEK
jgi:hypothetical protein